MAISIILAIMFPTEESRNLMLGSMDHLFLHLACGAFSAEYILLLDIIHCSIMMDNMVCLSD